MHKPDMDLDEQAYEPDHIEAVLSELAKNFPLYFQSFCPSVKAARQAFADAIEEWENDNPKYVEFLDSETLDEYEPNPNSFRGALKRECPIVRKCLNSKAKEMDKFRMRFYATTGREFLDKTKNIAAFGQAHVTNFDHKTHEKATEVGDLGLSDLLTEDYIVYGVIGGGIKSLLLYSLYPHAFPSRSQDAIWALYFLSGKKDFGLSDDSEFLMIDAKYMSIVADRWRSAQGYAGRNEPHRRLGPTLTAGGGEGRPFCGRSGCGSFRGLDLLPLFGEATRPFLHPAGYLFQHRC